MRTQGIAFAIPVNMVRSIADELIAKGQFKRGALGFVTENLSYEAAQEMNLLVTRGAAVKFVFPGTPAAEIGVKKGEVIVAINGQQVRSHSDYVARASTSPIGKQLAITLISQNGSREVLLTVADVVVPPMSERPPMGLTALNGLALGAMLPGFKLFGLVQGARVLVVDNELLVRGGLKPDDVIMKIDDQAVRTPSDVFDAVRSKMGRYRLEVFRDGRTLWMWLES